LAVDKQALKNLTKRRVGGFAGLAHYSRAMFLFLFFKRSTVPAHHVQTSYGIMFSPYCSHEGFSIGEKN